MTDEERRKKVDDLIGFKPLDTSYIKSFLSMSEEEQNEIIRKEKEMRVRAHERKITTKIWNTLRPVLYTPLSIFFRVLSFISRIAGGIASIAMLYGLYCAWKAYSAWKAGEVFSQYIQTSVTLILLPFIAFAIAIFSEKLWFYFDENK